MVVPTEDSVITEMTSTLRDWGAMWKQLYVVNIVVNAAVRPQPDVGCLRVCRNVFVVEELPERNDISFNYLETSSLFSLVKETFQFLSPQRKTKEICFTDCGT